MKEQKTFRKKYVDKKIKILHHVFIGLMLYMLGVVLYDSFVHNLPFNYILFWFTGIIVGRLFSKTQTVTKNHDNNKFTMQVNPTGIALTILLLVFRFFAGTLILEEFNVVWAADAIYLVFIGIYSSRLKNIIRQIDDRVYDFLFEGKDIDT